MSSQRPTTTSTISSTATSTATNDLRQALHLLTLASHRNKNQHRRSRWWKELSVLRRNVRKLVLVKMMMETTTTVHKVVDREAGGKEMDKGMKMEKEREMERRTRFLREQIIPRAWIAFSGLVADGQYAGLGMMLVGVLGRVVRGLGGLDGGTGVVGEVGEEDVGKVEEAEKWAKAGVGAGEDLGVPLVREEVAESEQARRMESEKEETRSKSEAVSAWMDKPTAKKKRKSKHQDVFDELFSELI